MADRGVIVQRSGPVYLVGDRRVAICVDVEAGSASGILDTQSLLAHTHVNDPWEVVDRDEDLPQLVADAIKQFLLLAG